MVNDTMEVAKGIGDVGMMAVTAAFFPILAAGLMVACFKWFKTLINDMIKDNRKVMTDLLDETKLQNEQLALISEGLRPATLLQIKNISNPYFDLSVEKVCRLIKKIREENHISDKEATKKKIHTLLENLHNERNTRLDSFSYKGNRLSCYTCIEWIDLVADVVEREVYDQTINNGRAYTNVTAVYERIRYEFYHKLDV